MSHMVGPVRATALAPKDAPKKSPALPVLLETSPFPLDNGKYARYHDFKFIAQGSFGTTSSAIDEAGRKVLVKEFNFRIAEGMSASQTWDVHDAFEREVNTIKSLDHPLVPKYLDSFARQVDGKVTFYLVTEYVEGPNLEERIAAGPITEAQASGIANDVLGVMKYFQSFSPPLLHRDITPKNIVLDAQGRAHVVDLGSVALKACTTIKGTICGTPGYAAPEQLLFGKASTASEVYGVGATLIRVLTRQEIADLVDDQGRINFRKYLNVSPEFAAILEKMIAPQACNRYANAEEALKAIDDLENGKSPAPDATQRFNLFHSRVLSPLSMAEAARAAYLTERQLDEKAKEVARSIRRAYNLAEKGKLSPDELPVSSETGGVYFNQDRKSLQVLDVELYSAKERSMWFFGSGVAGSAVAGVLLGSIAPAVLCGVGFSIACSIAWNLGERRKLFGAVRKILSENSERSQALLELHAALERIVEEKKKEPSFMRRSLRRAAHSIADRIPGTLPHRERRDAERRKKAMLEEEGRLLARQKAKQAERLERLARPQDPFPGTDGAWTDLYPFPAALQGPDLSPAEAARLDREPSKPTFLERIRRHLPLAK